MQDLLIDLIIVLGFTLFFIFIVAYATRRKSIEITFDDKREFFKKIGDCFFKVGYQVESEMDNFVIYKLRGVRVGITIEENKATLIGPASNVKRVIDLYCEKKTN